MLEDAQKWAKVEREKNTYTLVYPQIQQQSINEVRRSQSYTFLGLYEKALRIDLNDDFYQTWLCVVGGPGESNT